MTMHLLPSNHWNDPTALRFGIGQIAELRAACKIHSNELSLFVTDPFIDAHEMVQSPLVHCADEGLQATLSDGTGANPTGDQIADGVGCYREEENDALIAFGGGSALDEESVKFTTQASSFGGTPIPLSSTDDVVLFQSVLS